MPLGVTFWYHSQKSMSSRFKVLSGSCLAGGYVLMPRSRPMPRSTSMPRSQPMPRYPLYSSLVFHCSQVPISVTSKCPAQPQFLLIFWSQPKHHSPPIHYMSLLPMVTRRPHSTLWPHTPWQLEVAHSRRLITCHHIPFISYPSSPPIPVSISLTPTIAVLVDPRSHDFSVSDYYSSVTSVV